MYKYDDSVKKWYLELAENNTQESTHRLMLSYINKVSEWEEEFSKSFTDFTLEEIKTMLIGFRMKSETALRTILSVLEQYELFACSKLLKASGKIQLIKQVPMEEILDNIAVEKRYVTRGELFNALKILDEKCKNIDVGHEDVAMDKLILLLLFEGVRGKGYEDLINIKLSDIDFENKRIYLPLSKKYVKIQEEEVWDLIYQVRNKKNVIYINQDGENIGKIPAGEPSNFLFIRPVITGKGFSLDDAIAKDKIDLINFTTYSVKIRIKNLVESIDMPYLTGATIYASGLAERVYKWVLETEKELNTGAALEYTKTFGEKANINNLTNIVDQLYIQ